MKKRLETKLFSNGAEFLVMAKLLLSNIETYKAYVNFEGYDLVCANPKKGLSAKIQVKSKNFVKDVSFYLNLMTNLNLIFMYLLKLIRLKKTEINMTSFQTIS